MAREIYLEEYDEVNVRYYFVLIPLSGLEMGASFFVYDDGIEIGNGWEATSDAKCEDGIWFVDATPITQPPVTRITEYNLPSEYYTRT